MSKHAIIAIVVAVVIILGAGAAIIYSRQYSPNNESTTATNTNQEVNEKVENEAFSSVVDAFTRGENTRCTFNVSTEDGDTSGTIYISGDNARGDFETTIDNESISTHMIKNGDTFLMWSDSFDTGIKMITTIEEWAKNIQDPEELETPVFDPNTQADLRCSTWTIDSELFAEPVGVEFLSLDGFLPSIIPDSESLPPNGTSNVNQCTICNSLTGDAKNICIQQFNCE